MLTYQVRRNFPQPYKGRQYKAGDTITSEDIGNVLRERQMTSLNWISPVTSVIAEAPADDDEDDDDEPEVAGGGGPAVTAKRRGRSARRRKVG